MSATKWAKGVAAAAIVATVLTGCSSTSSGSGDDGGVTPVDDSGYGGLSEHTITLKDGRTVTCVVYQDFYKGGLSCDWVNS